ncbi:MAG: hypothetical protein WAT25_12900 [Paracoccaceae bacterium]
MVLPISRFERAGHSGCGWRPALELPQSHIPQNPGYEEKFYITPGDTGIRAIDTKYARIG